MADANYVDIEQMAPTTSEKEVQNCCCVGSWLIKDVCGIICAVLTWLLILYAEFVVMKVVLVPTISTHPVYSYVNIVIFQFLAFHALASHLKTMFTDPGAVPKGNATEQKIKEMGLPKGQIVFICTKCQSYKPARSHHCSVCQRCIKKMDHHCPWVNNCVGEGNQKYFVLFTFYIAMMSVQAFSICVFQFLNCNRGEWHECSVYSLSAIVILIIEALVFTIFTTVTLGFQLHSIWNDETFIEQLKTEQVGWIRKSGWESMQAVFGGFSIFWFSPFVKPTPIRSDVSSLRV